MRMPYEV